MLSKDVCFHCLDKNLREVECAEMSYYEWRWKEGYVFCPTDIDAMDNKTFVGHPPPPFCPYKFEHSVAYANQRVE